MKAESPLWIMVYIFYIVNVEMVKDTMPTYIYSNPMKAESPLWIMVYIVNVEMVKDTTPTAAMV